MATTSKTAKTTPAPAEAISAELKQVLRTLKLGKLLLTLPERLTLTRQQSLHHADFPELVLADEVARRDTNSAALRARAAGLEPGMRLDTWTPPQRSTSTSDFGTSWSRCGSSTHPTALDPGSGRVGKPTWPPRSGTSRYAAASACT